MRQYYQTASFKDAALRSRRQEIQLFHGESFKFKIVSRHLSID
jgi:hypothetical protein